MPVTSGKTAGAIASAVAGVNLRIDTGALVDGNANPANFRGFLSEAILTVPQMSRLTWHIIRLAGSTPVEVATQIAYRRTTPTGGKYDLEFVPALPPIGFPASGTALITLNTVVAEAMTIDLLIPGTVPVPDPANRFLIFLSASA
jgi:hypothetical protein